MGILVWGKRIFTSIVDIRADKWLGYQNLKTTSKRLFVFVKLYCTQEQAEFSEDFDTAVNRLHLEQSDLKDREHEFIRLFITYLSIAIFIFFYAIYLFMHKNWGGGLMALCLTLYPINLAFRFHFWLFQIRNKKLGCSLKEWWNS